MNILVMGAGALGGYFGGRLAAAGHDVTFVARGAHLEAMQKIGLKIESPTGNVHLEHVNAVPDPKHSTKADIVLFLVKNFDVEAAAHILRPSLKPESLVVTLQNGVSAPQRLGEIIGHERVVPGVALIPADVRAPGVIRHSSKMQKIVFGQSHNANDLPIEGLAAALNDVGVEATISEDVQVMLWTKFVMLSALSAMTTLTRLDIGPLRKTPQTAALFRQALNETEAVGRVICHNLPEGTADAQWQFLLDMPDTIHASMLDDLRRGKPIELNFLSGDVSRLGREKGVPTPLHDFVTAALQPYVNGVPAAG